MKENQDVHRRNIQDISDVDGLRGDRGPTLRLKRSMDDSNNVAWAENASSQIALKRDSQLHLT